MVVCAIDRPRSAIISIRSRRLSLNRRYQRTHRMMTSRSKWRPSNSSSTLFSLPIADPQPFSRQHSRSDRAVCTRARIATRNTHGTGCTLSAAIAVLLPRFATVEAVRRAKAYLTAALTASHRLTVDGGRGPVHHFHALWTEDDARGPASPTRLGSAHPNC